VSTGGDHVDVLIVANADDRHHLVVDGSLRELEARTLRLNLSDLASTQIVTRPGSLDIAEGDSWSRVDRETTVWWFRAGRPVVDEGAAADEAQLIIDESPSVLIGSLRAAGVRWVDDPDTIRRAEWKLSQLTVAAGLDIRTPRWTATNSPPVAQQFADGHPLVAKALSAGTGIAPYAAAVPTEELGKPNGVVTLFQQLVTAAADLRVVVIDGQTWAWRRAREPGTIDWRAVDRRGAGFAPVSADAMGVGPARITSSLGLTMSVQDWLETSDGPVFLEANPQGAWLFLSGASTTVAPALAYHLRHGTKETAGDWPAPRRRAFYDFYTKEKAPAQDAVIPPRFAPPVWADEVAAIPGAGDAAKTAREAAEDAAKTAEDKASRLVQITLALLTVALAVGSYQLTFALQRSWPWLSLLAPIAVALVCLAIAAFESVLIDRVGFYYQPSGQDLAGAGNRDASAILLAEEERGRRLARWSANHKHSDLMQARAWFTRGLAALLIAGLTAGICRATATASSPSRQTTRHATTTTPSPSPASSHPADHQP